MQISWVLIAEKVRVNQQCQTMDIIGEFRRVVADQFPYAIPTFYIVCRVEAAYQEPLAVPYNVTLRRPSDEVLDLHRSQVSLQVAPNAGQVVGNLIAEIQNLEFESQGSHTLKAQLGDSVFSTVITVIRRRNNSNGKQE